MPVMIAYHYTLKITDIDSMQYSFAHVKKLIFISFIMVYLYTIIIDFFVLLIEHFSKFRCKPL